MTNAEWIRNLSEEQLAEFLDVMISLGYNGCRAGDYDTPARFGEFETLQWVRAEHLEGEE